MQGARGAGPTLEINSSKSKIIRALNLSIWAKISGQGVFGALLSEEASLIT